MVSHELEAPHDDREQDKAVEERRTGRWLRKLRHSVAAAKELESAEEILACIKR